VIAYPVRRANSRVGNCSVWRSRVHSCTNRSSSLRTRPTGNLDPDSADQVLALLRDQIKTRQAAGILVTHSRHAASSADRVLMLGPDGLREEDLQRAAPI